MKYLSLLLLFLFQSLFSPSKTYSSEVQTNGNKQSISPWYTGPLIAGGGYVASTAVINTQPYLFVLVNSESYDSEWKSHPLLYKRVTVNPAFYFGTGITSWMDCSVTCNLNTIQEAGITQTGIADTTVAVSFQLYVPSKDSLLPAIRIGFKETFPTGSYMHMNPGNLYLFTGNGYYQSWISLSASKIIKFFPSHPMNFRLNFGYAKNANLKLQGATAYGGAPDTNATLKPGDNYTATAAAEFSLTQSWVLALDFFYSHQNKITFSGNPGHAEGQPVPLASPSADVFSLAPALEYNINLNAGFLLAAWFSITGRNTSQFAGGAFSFTCNF